MLCEMLESCSFPFLICFSFSLLRFYKKHFKEEMKLKCINLRQKVWVSPSPILSS